MPSDFANAGFMSDEAEVFRQAVRVWPKAQPWFQLATDINAFVLDLIRHHQVEAEARHEVIFSALFFRAHHGFQAAILLAERGLTGESRTISRNVTEGAIAMHAIAADPKFIKKLQQSHKAVQRKFGRLAIEKYSESMAAADLTAIEAVLAEPKPSDRSEVVWANIAQQVCPALYDLLYRDLSNIAAHTNLNTISEFIDYDKETGIPHGFRSVPDTEKIVESLRVATLAFIWAIEPFIRQYPGEGRDDRFLRLVAEFNEIQDKLPES